MSEPTLEKVADDGRALRFRLTSAAVLALSGGILTIVSNLLQQRQDIPRGDPLATLEYIAANPWWHTAALVGVLGIVCWAMALPMAGRTLADPTSRAIARMGEPVLLAVAATFAVHYAHDGFSSGVLAQQWTSGELDDAAALADSRVLEGLVGGTSTLSQTLLGLALLLYAVAMLRSGQHSRVWSWIGVIGALGWFIGGAALFLQLPGMSFELLLPFVGLATVWLLGLGVGLLRRGLRASPPAPT